MNKPALFYGMALASAIAWMTATTAAAGVPVAVLNGSFEEGSTPITATVAGVKPIGYTTTNCVEYPDIQKEGRFDDSLASPPNDGVPGQPTGNNGRPHSWDYSGSVIQDAIATDSRWGGVWNAWTSGQTDGRTAIILDNRTPWPPPSGICDTWMKQTLAMDVGQLKALGTSLQMSFDARYRAGNEDPPAEDADGDDFVRVYFEVDGVQDAAGTWETSFLDATRKVHTFKEINGQYPQDLWGAATRDNPARNPAGSVGSQNMETFVVTLDLSGYDEGAIVKLVIYNHRERDAGVASTSGRVYMDNFRLEAIGGTPPTPATPGLLIYGK